MIDPHRPARERGGQSVGDVVFTQKVKRISAHQALCAKPEVSALEVPISTPCVAKREAFDMRRYG